LVNPKKREGIKKYKNIFKEKITMSLGIIIGSDVDDVQNLSDTIEVLKFTKNAVGDGVLSLSTNSSFDSDKLDHIITWYTGIHTLLTDPAAFLTNDEDQTG
jgi:hypothetical protein